MVEQLEMRRTMREYGFEGAVRKFGVWLENEDLGLAGKLDLLLETETEAAIVEFKLTSGEVGQNHRLQLGGYSLLVEAEMAKHVKCGFVYRIPDGRVFPVPIDEGLRREVRQAWTRFARRSQPGCYRSRQNSGSGAKNASMQTIVGTCGNDKIRRSAGFRRRNQIREENPSKALCKWCRMCRWRSGCKTIPFEKGTETCDMDATSSAVRPRCKTIPYREGD